MADDSADEDYNDDDSFEPIRESGKPLRRSHTRVDSEPITIDERMAKLTENHRAVVNDFIQNAQAIGRKLIVKKSLRSAPFTDTELTEMAVNFTTTKQEMEAIPGIDLDKVNLYANDYLPLVRQAAAFYDSIGGGRDEPVHDPNHDMVVDLVSDDSDEEFRDGEFTAADLESTQEEPEGERSGYFASSARNNAATDVAAFNSRLQQARKSRPEPRSFNDDNDSRSRAKSVPGRERKAGGPSRGFRGRGKPYPKKISTARGDSSKNSGGGMSNYGNGEGRSANDSSRGHSRASGGGQRPQGNQSGIFAMPT